MKRPLWQSQMVSGLFPRQAIIVNVAKGRGARVMSLKPERNPAAVIRLVMTVWVNAVKRMAWRAWTHVLQEVREILLPSFTHGDTSASVVLVPDLFGPETTVKHRAPAAVFARELSSRVSMGGVPIRHLCFQAAAALCVAAAKIGDRCSVRATTVTLAEPQYFRALLSAVTRSANDGEGYQASETLPGYVGWKCHV